MCFDRNCYPFSEWNIIEMILNFDTILIQVWVLRKPKISSNRNSQHINSLLWFQLKITLNVLEIMHVVHCYMIEMCYKNFETHWRVNLWRLCKFHYSIIVCRGNVFKLFSMCSQVRQHWVDLNFSLVLYNWWQKCVSCSLYIRHGDTSNAWLMFIERCSWN